MVVVSRLVDCRGAVAFLGVKLSTVRSVCAHWVQVVLTICECVAGWVVSKVGLVHQLLVETRGDRHVLACRAGGPSLLPLEELGEDEFLLVSHAVNVYTFALDCSAKINRQTVKGYFLTKMCCACAGLSLQSFGRHSLHC